MINITISVLFQFFFISYVIGSSSKHLAYIIEIQDPKSYLTAHPKAKLRHIYNSSILTGLSVHFGNAHDAYEAIEDTNIVQVWPVSQFARPMSTRAFQQVPEAARNLTVQNLAYKNLHHNGSGIRIGVIDSGVDYTHPALGGCFGPGCKVRYGYDLVGDDYNGDITTLKPDQDPLDNCGVGSEGTGHGTHVSGIIAAEDKMLNWTGVAPGATLGMWRVFSCHNVLTPNDILIKAMEMAFNAGMDIINLSLGENGGWSEDPLSIIADRIADAGTHVVVASGDAGASGVFLTAAPATGKKVISTGSIDNRIVAAHILEIKGQKNVSVAYRTADNFPIYNQTSHAITSITSSSTGKQRNACQTVHASLSNLYVLVERGACPDSLQAQNLAKAGAAAVILSSIPGQDTAIGLISVGIPVVSVTHEAGQQLLEVISRKKNDGKSKHKISKTKAVITARLTTELTVLPVSTGGLISAFSTLGPTNELELKPDVSAIGGYVFSTVPAYLGSYGTISGTSMSAPFISGSVALLLGYNTSLTAEQAMGSIMNYAQPVSVQVGNRTLLDSPVRQGSGVVNITASISCINTISVNPPKLSFNDTEHMEEYYTLAITNHQNSQVAVSLSYQNAATVVGFNFTSQATSAPLEPSNFLATSSHSDYAHISFPFRNFTLQSGQTVHVNITITPPSTNDQMHTLYGGYIYVEGNHCTATIPYIGMSGNMRDLQVLDRIDGTETEYSFPSIGNPNNTILQTNETGIYTLNQTYPSVLARLSTGTAIAQIQVQDTLNKILGDLPLQIISNQTSPNPRAWVVRNVGATSTGGTYFKIWKWDFSYLPINATIWGQNRHMSNLRSVRPGTYHLKLRVLKVFGNRRSKHDWEEWLSPPLRIVLPDHHRNISQSSTL
ncbi:hypothetical protein INT43_006726 [Umbelopsis isabellina]|uniref:Peptidase S8/S53 domain-containing protein n=1 Tax=Mortierella isabellina TaxID=91625 RepID=A0A8H7Q1B7_MORIS|nr:hypothetical protein INT43_006726 [Umbelopsis isabellina]